MLALGADGTLETQLTQQVAFGTLQTSETFVNEQFDVTFLSPSIAITKAAPSWTSISVLTWDLTSMSLIQNTTFPSTGFGGPAIVGPTGRNVFVWSNSALYLLDVTEKGVGDVSGQLSVQEGVFAIGREYAFVAEQNNQLYRVPYS
eukprot:TRINITY_DN6030_c0_g1_i1.p2 TRINITY_DN6030_c0_g1~~TRINITY_DN6030_c0_g1_i1.p2  ORF type:complete len:146 (-),score=13.55 TRINITY_DN6030_c0_g1_i1:55-492(-)